MLEETGRGQTMVGRDGPARRGHVGQRGGRGHPGRDPDPGLEQRADDDRDIPFRRELGDGRNGARATDAPSARRPPSHHRTSAAGNVVKAFIVLAEGNEPSDELATEIGGFVREHLSAYAYPRRIEFVDELPKTLTGKIRRIELREAEREAPAGT